MATTAEMQGYANSVADNKGIPRDIFRNVITTESHWNPNARSDAGAIGLGQLMPGTAAGLGVNPLDWQQNLNGAGEYLSQLYERFGDWTTAVAAYNAGPGRINRVLKGNASLPTETQNYINKIFGKDAAVTTDGTSSEDKVSMNPLDWMAALANFFSFNTGARLLAIVVGLVFLIAAVFVLVSGTKTGQQVIQTGVKLAAVA